MGEITKRQAYPLMGAKIYILMGKYLEEDGFFGQR
jgi:hypothetical protein